MSYCVVFILYYLKQIYNFGFNFCNQPRCKFCPLLTKSGVIKSHTIGLTHPCMKKISCRGSNVIYAITCTRCGVQYVAKIHPPLKGC